jgi:hypothetical protein
MTQHLSRCAIAVPRVPFESMQLQQFAPNRDHRDKLTPGYHNSAALIARRRVSQATMSCSSLCRVPFTLSLFDCIQLTFRLLWARLPYPNLFAARYNWEGNVSRTRVCFLRHSPSEIGFQREYLKPYPLLGFVCSDATAQQRNRARRYSVKG